MEPRVLDLIVTSWIRDFESAISTFKPSNHWTKDLTKLVVLFGKCDEDTLLLDSLKPSIEAEDINSKYITWGMILIELHNFALLCQSSNITKTELINITKSLIDKCLQYETQYIDHLKEGEFVILTPVDIIVTNEECQLLIKDDSSKNDQLMTRLQEITVDLLSNLLTEEDSLEFICGIALKDSQITTDEQWFENAKKSLENTKKERDENIETNEIN